MLQKINFKLLLTISVFCVFGALLFIWKINDKKISFYQTFIVAKSKISKGEVLSIENTTLVSLVLKKSASYFVQNSEFSAFNGLIVREDIEENQIISKGSLFIQDSIESKIPKGKRLYILDVPIGPIVSILKENDSIDLIAQMDIPGFGHMTETILEAVKLIDISENIESSADDAKYLSFYLTPDEVKILAFMKPYAQFSVVLRNSFDEKSSATYPMTFNRFIQNDKIRKMINSESFQFINGKNLNSLKQKHRQ